jgi:hypothetical protein
VAISSAERLIIPQLVCLGFKAGAVENIAAR